MKKLMLAGAASALALAVATSAGAATVQFDFAGVGHQNNLGPTETYVVSGLTLIASGFNQFNTATNLYGKHDSLSETGLGLANDPSGQNEISWHMGFVQLDVQGLFGKVIGSTLQFGTNSTTQGETWAVYGTNTAGNMSGATFLTNGTSEGLHNLSGLGTYKYYDFISSANSGGKNFLITSLTGTLAVPEPTSWALMIIGFGGIGAAMRRRRSVASAVTA
jgi:hypothetical protein